MCSLFDQLDREWERLVTRAEVTAGLADACAVIGATTPSELIPRLRQADVAQADALLAALASRACTGDEIAARALLQCLVPGMCRLVARWWSMGDSEDRAAYTVSAVWDRIRNYPIDRRPARIAANILLDAGHELQQVAVREREYATQSVAVEPSLLPMPGDSGLSPAEELTKLVTDVVAGGFIRPDDAGLVLASRVNDEHMRSIAQRRGRPRRTLEWRRHQTEAKLRVYGAVA